MSALSGPTFLANGDLYWQGQAACRNTDTDTFFLPDAIRGPRKKAREAAAKAICYSCPVMAACLEWALAGGEAHGVWGGTTPEERDQLAATARMAG
jgi:WhiB family transcriptional regulator, redox-sensing transcriptional regulator